MAISAKDVMELRKATGAGMMDCKKALQESAGDIDGALDYLRKKGQKVAAKRADKDANEGFVVTMVNDSGDKGIVMALSCETDFVAKNEGFQAFANSIAKIGMDNLVPTREALLAMSFDGATVEEKLVEETGKMGEKVEVSDYQMIEGSKLASYIHAGSKIGVLLSFEDDGKDGADFFRSVAMHVAAMSPSILSPDEFEADYVAKEAEGIRSQIEIENEDRQRLGKALRTVPEYASKSQLTPEVMSAAEATIKAELEAEGKPEKIWDKIVPGKLERFVADNTLLDQEHCLLSQFFALDDTKTVEQAIREFAEGAKILEFRRVAVG